MIDQVATLIKKYNIPFSMNFQKQEIPFANDFCKIMPAIRMAVSSKNSCTLQFHSSVRIKSILQNRQSFQQFISSQPNDIQNFLKSNSLFITEDLKLPEIIKQLGVIISGENQYPFTLAIENTGIMVISEDSLTNLSVINLFQFIAKEEIKETSVFTYPNQTEELKHKRANQKIVIITGGAQGFGEGIVEDLFENGANVIIADINEQKGLDLANKLNSFSTLNRAYFIKTNITRPDSVQNMVNETVRFFGGIDCVISNAGVLIAGGLDELSAEAFDKVTQVNYYGYFNIAKYASEILKIQSAAKPGYFTDIIQISSKSGLQGSNRNFAYAGSKFGGIGLTQSFALELVEYNIKVNSICPGNFFDGPLWSDPEKGLFVQYLRTGKVPGAKTIADVKKFYESKVPMKRGCSVSDVMKAIYYIMDQDYETGQAIAVTGGQVMLH